MIYKGNTNDEGEGNKHVKKRKIQKDHISRKYHQKRERKKHEKKRKYKIYI